MDIKKINSWINNTLSGQEKALADYRNSLMPDFNSKNYLGQDYGFLRDFLTNQAQSGLSNKKDLLSFNKRAIERSIGASRRAIAEDFAGRGTFGSAAQAQLMSNLAGEKALAMEKSAQDVNLLDMNARQQAIGQLLGLNQFAGQTEFNTDQAQNRSDLAWRGLFENQRQFNEQMQFQEDNQPGWFGEFLGNLLGAGAQVGSAAILASDRRLKENISVVGETDGIPLVEFNYIGSPKRFKGVIAQDVEKVKPEAVVSRDGIKYVDYSKLNVNMTEVQNG